MPDQHQSPFTDYACPAPSATEGDQGIGGGLDAGGGGDGNQFVWKDSVVPVPSNMDESGPFGTPSRFSSIDGSTHKGETLQGDITSPPSNTLDKK